MKKIITYEVHGQLFDHKSTALCFEAIMVMRTMLNQNTYLNDKSEGKWEPMLYTDEQLDILLNLIVLSYNQYQVTIESVVDDWRNGKIDFGNLTVDQIRGYADDKMNGYFV